MAMCTGFSFGTEPFDPTNRFETSWLLPPWMLLACRALISIYIFTTLFFIMGYTCSDASLGGCLAVRRSFSYFTVITFWGLGFYFAVSSVHTLTYVLRRRPLLASFPRPLQALHSLFYTSVVTLPFLVTIVYWAVLYKAPWFELVFDAWHNVTQHGLNSLFALFELVFARTEAPPWAHLAWLIAVLLGYLAIAFITLAAQGWYTYSFLDHSAVGGRGYVAAYVVGIAVGVVVVFAIVWAAIRLRKWVTEVKLGRTGKFVVERRADVEMRHQAKPDGQGHMLR
ncbi:FAR-17a/AIG1-like protein [Metarhizium album ARSEF 1941]|uniref:FAR-17a/AIG1-like protein n=1 Tax=Metarhizium album (strain ARSEF 1941) TaxID=1081103 RepID=A0A0B2WKT7_METAS|nr:FAR-17a/AIG1-like protein [Metarhizium album ARSEF 1941]KHN94563.1 FAR-17a/AIG1-like protein [Metarhizium album ARSEF 1941]